MRASELFVPHGQEVLQRAVRIDGEDSGHRVQVRASGVQGEDRSEQRGLIRVYTFYSLKPLAGRD
jgi:hypothetical protein